MLKLQIGFIASAWLLTANGAAAQSVGSSGASDSLRNATPVGLAAAIGSSVGRGAVECDSRVSACTRVVALKLPEPGSLPAATRVQQWRNERRRDSVWDGTLIGAGIGAAGGAVWGMKICGSNDGECFAIAGPVGIISGAGIGAAIGAIADAIHR